MFFNDNFEMSRYSIVWCLLKAMVRIKLIYAALLILV